MNDVAQTNLHLLNQLRSLGWHDDELAIAGRSYELATRIFSGQYRASGKPFVAHLVGTASIVATLQEPPQVVLAALLHAAYSHGDFGDGVSGISTTKQAILRETIGTDAECVVERYTRTPWGRATVAAFGRQGRSLPTSDRQVAILRIANDAEDHLELGMLYCAAPWPVPLADDAALAEQLDRPQLAALIRTLEDEEQRGNVVPSSVRCDTQAAYLVAPLSYRPRVRVRVARIARGARHAVAKVPVVGSTARRLRRAGRRLVGARRT